MRAIYDQQALAGSHVISLENFEKNFQQQADTIVMIKAAPGQAESVRAPIESLLKQYPNGKLQDRAQFKAAQAKQITQLLNLIYALLMMAIIIAVFGIGNTLALSIFERTHEIGLLRAVGMTRAQVRSVVRWEAVIIALFGTLLGLLIGVFFGWVLVQALKDQGIASSACRPGRWSCWSCSDRSSAPWPRGCRRAGPPSSTSCRRSARSRARRISAGLVPRSHSTGWLQSCTWVPLVHACGVRIGKNPSHSVLLDRAVSDSRVPITRATDQPFRGQMWVTRGSWRRRRSGEIAWV